MIREADGGSIGLAFAEEDCFLGPDGVRGGFPAAGPVELPPAPATMGSSLGGGDCLLFFLAMIGLAPV